MEQIQILNNGDTLNAIRTKINENFQITRKAIENNATDPFVKFSANSGNETNGVADILTRSEDATSLTFKVGGEYPNLVYTNGNGETFEVSSLDPLYFENLSAGNYIVLVNGTSTQITSSPIYYQLIEPEEVNSGDIWFNGNGAYQALVLDGTVQWMNYSFTPIGEVVFRTGKIGVSSTYPYNSNRLHEASSSSFGLLRTAAVVDEVNCHCEDAVLTPANLYSLNNYRTMNTEYQVGDKVGCPYHHNLQLTCIQAGTTSNEVLNTKGTLEAGDNIEDGTVIWEVEELGTGGGSAGAGLQMFDTITKDYILTYKESKGLALQGTYVYKDAVPGSRYGYPDFYNKCLEEYQNTTEEKEYVKTLANIYGTEIKDREGSISFGTENNKNNYVTTGCIIPSSKPWELVCCAHLGDNADAINVIFGTTTAYKTGFALYVENESLRIALGSTGTSYDIAPVGSAVGTHIINDGCTYWFKVEFTGSAYNVYYSGDKGITWNLDITVESSTPIYQNTNHIVLGGGCIGASTWYGEVSWVDLRGAYINVDGERLWSGVEYLTYKKNANGHLFYDIAQKDTFDTIYEQHGVAWYYGVDEENERIFLPRNNYFDQLTGNTDEVGLGVEAGVPEIYATAFSGSGAASLLTGAIQYTKGVKGESGGSGGDDIGWDFKASRCSSVYANSETVQPNAVKKLLYICVGNTEVQSSITDVVDVTTTENDTTPLFTGLYFDFKPNNLSWLKGGQQANNSGIYATCYNELVNVLNGETKYGDLKVINEADMEIGVDYSEYWKVNQEDMTFTTPTAISNKALSGAVVGNGMTLGLTDGTKNFGLSRSVSEMELQVKTQLYGSSLPSSYSQTGTQTGSGSSLGIVTDPTTSGIKAEQSQAQLYFKVANAVQNLELLNAGEVMEAVNEMLPNNSNLICGYGIPDYSSVITVFSTAAAEGTFTAPCNGFMIFDIANYGNAGYIMVNGIDIMRRTQASNYMTDYSFVLPVNKNDVVAFKNGYSTVGYCSQTVKFAPMKGAN